MALRWVLAAAVAVVASAAGFKGPEAPAPTTTTELERLKALVSQLAEDHSADEPQQKAQELPELKPRRAPEPEFASKTVEGMVSLETTTRSSGVPNPEGNANEAVMVFDEAASSVERSLRRLMPSPAPTGKTFCTACHQMHNGAVDEAGAEMCSKKQGKGASKLVSCYKKYGDCPSDMSEYTCDGDAPPPPSPPMVPEGMCTPAKVHAIRTLKAEVRLCPMRPNCRGMSGVLPPRPHAGLQRTHRVRRTLRQIAPMIDQYLSLRSDHLTMTEQMLVNAETDSNCACAPVEEAMTELLGYTVSVSGV